MISTPTNRGDEGFIFLDVIIALLILSLTLTAVYPVFIRSIQLEKKMVTQLEELIKSGETYDETIIEYIE